ncbi:MAG: carboxypeptidase regulatory-like domain-containing protein, partial [Acidobacteria bacterium]|nr:carboxypeptidase regulatory-like domain-containing protein [Acidobacteriota bacterium]
MDQTGASIADVAVTITNVANSLRRSAVTTSAGNYELSLLLAGEYRLEASGPGVQERDPVRYRPRYRSAGEDGHHARSGIGDRAGRGDGLSSPGQHPECHGRRGYQEPAGAGNAIERPQLLP